MALGNAVYGNTKCLDTRITILDVKSRGKVELYIFIDGNVVVAINAKNCKFNDILRGNITERLKMQFKGRFWLQFCGKATGSKDVLKFYFVVV